MKVSNKIKNLILWGFVPALFAAGASSCSAINEDLDPCAPAPRNYTVVDFVYDYNMYETDLFDQHAGSVYLYIFDENGIFMRREAKHKEFFEPGEDFTMTFGEDELIPGTTYNFVAVAQGNTMGVDYQSDDYQWFKVVNPLVAGQSSIRDYILRLDRETPEGFTEIGVINYKDQFGQTQQMIDTLWTTKPDEVQRVTINKLENYKPSKVQQPDNVTHVTVPMMRITNSIVVNLLAPSFDANTDVDSYHIVIHYPNGNGTVDFTGDISQSPQALYYQSLIKRMRLYSNKKDIRTRADDDENWGVIPPDDDFNPDVYALTGWFGVSRLMLDDDSRLQLYRADDLTTPIFEIPNFSEVLARYLNEGDYDDQEFLDREYNFEIDLALGGDGSSITSMTLTCSVLKWARRIYFYDLD